MHKSKRDNQMNKSNELNELYKKISDRELSYILKYLNQEIKIKREIK